MNRRIFLQNTGIVTAMLASSLNFKRKVNAQEKVGSGSRSDVIDFYSHFSSMRVIDYLESAGGPRPHVFRSLFTNTPTLINVEKRLELMDAYGITRSVLVPLPWIETAPEIHADPKKCLQAAKILNDTLAEIATRRPDRFSAVALLPTTNEDILAEEFQRSIKELNMVGGFFVVGPTVKPPDHRDYEEMYKMAVEMDVPLWIHPSRPPSYPDYQGENLSRYQVWQSLAWLQDSSTAMVRIVFSGVYDRYPDLKLVTHHHGAMIPLFAERMQYGWDYFEQNTGREQPTDISKPYIEHFRKFYCDTATQGVSPQLLDMACSFFGADHVLFGSDAPMDATSGKAFTRDAIASVSKMSVSESEKDLIFRSNAQQLLKLA